MEENVRFVNRFLEKDELIRYLQATDVYIIPYPGREQISSGTLLYALSTGKAIVSTPFLQAGEVISEGCVMECDFKNPGSIADCVKTLLQYEDIHRKLEQKAYRYSRDMIWPNVALSYVKIFEKHAKLPQGLRDAVPDFNLEHLISLTDDFGIIQFANHAVPDIESGYSLDDNSRALIVCGRYYQSHESKSVLKLIQRYLKFIRYVQEDDGRMHNFVDLNRVVDREHWSVISCFTGPYSINTNKQSPDR